MSLRKNILQIKVKVHSAFHKFFEDTEYTIDAITALDVFLYLRSMHPRFSSYMTQTESRASDEDFAFLDKDLKMIDVQAIEFKKFKEGDVVHLVPLIVGGGGKRGLLAFFAIAAFIVFLPAIAGALAPGAGAGVGVGAPLNAIPQLGAVNVGAGKAGLSMGGFLKKMAGNLLMNIVSKIFTKSGKANSDENVRDNNMFGSLKNTTSSGTPIPLHYGLMRVSGQFLSGYIQTNRHGKSDQVNVGAEFDGT